MVSHDFVCVNDGRISRLESEVNVNSKRLNSVDGVVRDLDVKIEGVDDKRHEDYLSLYSSIGDLESEIVAIHTTIRNVSLIVSLLGLVIAFLLAVPDLSLLFS